MLNFIMLAILWSRFDGFVVKNDRDGQNEKYITERLYKVLNDCYNTWARPRWTGTVARTGRQTLAA